MPHFSLTITGLPVISCKNGFGLTGVNVCKINQHLVIRYHEIRTAMVIKCEKRLGTCAQFCVCAIQRKGQELLGCERLLRQSCRLAVKLTYFQRVFVYRFVSVSFLLLNFV